MLTAAAIAISTLTTIPIQAGDYYPLVPGSKWTYREENTFAHSSYTDVVKDPVEIKGEMTYPVEMVMNDKVVDTVYYRAAPDAVYIIGYDLKRALEKPRPVFKIGPGTQKWEFEGLTVPGKDGEPLSITGESVVKGRRKVLERETEVLEVQLTAKIGPAGDLQLTTRQTMVYAKGIGLVEMQEKTTMAKKTQERKLKLVEYVPGHP